MLDHCKGCIISNDTPCEMGLSASHLFKSNTMRGNPFWDYSNPNNAVVMCSKHHDEFEKLNAEYRIAYIILNMNPSEFKDEIVSRMKTLLKGKKPISIYPRLPKRKKQTVTEYKQDTKEFLPDEKF